MLRRLMLTVRWKGRVRMATMMVEMNSSIC
jgi:hypothetical protein